MNIKKIKQNNSLPDKYSISPPGKYAEVLYILVYINIYISNYMDSVHYVCDILYYNTGIWCDFDDDTTTKYSGYPKNL